MSSMRAASKPSRAKTCSAERSNLPRVASVRACCRDPGTGKERLDPRATADAMFGEVRGLPRQAIPFFQTYIHVCILKATVPTMQEEVPAALQRAVQALPWHPRHNPWAIALTVTLATFMEVLDTSIANVALPHIAGGLSAGQDESTWVLTSYLVSNAIVLPLSGWLSSIVGRKNFYMGCVELFTISSFLCGLAPSLGMLILFRILQGAGGGGLQPSEQAILNDTFPLEKRG